MSCVIAISKNNILAHQASFWTCCLDLTILFLVNSQCFSPNGPVGFRFARVFKSKLKYTSIFFSCGLHFIKCRTSKLRGSILTSIQGMSNNLPLYPLLRKGRDVDIIVCFDASADIKQENWLSVAEGYAKQRGVKGWPIGAGWPETKDEAKKELDAADSVTAQQAAGKIADVREQRRTSRNFTKDAMTKSKDQNQNETDLGYCNVWVGTTMERQSEIEPPQSRVDPNSDWKLLEPNAGITVIYFPFLPNPAVEGVDPNTSDFMSTWNFVYTAAEIDKVVALAKANFKAGEDQTKRAVRAVYERKKAKRLESEATERIRHWRKHLREAGNHFQ